MALPIGLDIRWANFNKVMAERIVKHRRVPGLTEGQD